MTSWLGPTARSIEAPPFHNHLDLKWTRRVLPFASFAGLEADVQPPERGPGTASYTGPNLNSIKLCQGPNEFVAGQGH